METPSTIHAERRARFQDTRPTDTSPFRPSLPPSLPVNDERFSKEGGGGEGGEKATVGDINEKAFRVSSSEWGEREREREGTKTKAKTSFFSNDTVRLSRA